MKKITTLLAVLSIVVPLSNLFAEKTFQGTLDINTASAEQLTQLPRIGPKKAEAIVTYRQAHPFKDVSELVEVKGIGSKLLEKLRPSVTVGGLAAVTPPSNPSKQ